VYRLFPSKDALFAEAYRMAAAREILVITNAAGSPGTAVERLDRAVRTSAERAMLGPRLGRALLVEPAEAMVEAERDRFRRAYRDALADLIADGITTGEFVPQDAVVTATAVLGSLIEVLLGPLSPLDRSATDRAAVLRQVLDLCRRAVAGTGVESVAPAPSI
jgi:AcrR family transcriptional regulator